MESARVLGDGVQLPAQRAERAAIDAVRMRRSIDIWTSLVNGRMDHVCCAVEQTAWPAINDLSLFVDENEIRGLDHGERNAEGIDPEGRRVHRIAQRDVPRNSFIEPVLAKDPECRCNRISSSWPPARQYPPASLPLRYARSLYGSSNFGGPGNWGILTLASTSLSPGS